MPYGLPDAMSPGDEEMPHSERDEMSGDPEVKRMVAEAFPGTEVDSDALMRLIQHCVDMYGPGGEDEEGEDMGPMSPKRGKKPGLEIMIGAFGKPKGGKEK